MIDIANVALELRNARAARINAELACCEMEELVETVRRAHLAFVRLTHSFQRSADTRTQSRGEPQR
jgi:hypothetical protein